MTRADRALMPTDEFSYDCPVYKWIHNITFQSRGNKGNKGND